jgi:hypothetical protein
MSAIISNADTMRELTKVYNNTSKDKRGEFQDLVAKLGMSYVESMSKISNGTT